MVALLGILKAGGAYLPIDPEYPEARRAFMLEDAGARFLVTEAALAGYLPDHGAALLVLDADASALADEPASRLPLEATAGNLAYVIYVRLDRIAQAG